MDALKELKRTLEREIEEIVKKSDISPAELERLDKAVDIIKDIETICAMKEYDYDQEDPEYSGRYPYTRPYYMRDDGMRSRDMWEGGSSYRRGRDSMGRYTSRDMMPMDYYNRSYGDRYGYSGHNSKEDIRMDLREMMNNAKSDKERMAIQNFLDNWKE